MVCLCCHTITEGRLCRRCVATFRPAPDRILTHGIRLVAAFEHVGSAKQLVHLLKYRGVLDLAELVAKRLSPQVPVLPLVPVPRAMSRRLRYGVDPAFEIARRLSRRNGAPIVRALYPPAHARRRAGRDHDAPVQEFPLRLRPQGPVIVVDDVVTTGATVEAAARALGRTNVHLALAANAVSGVSGGVLPR